MRLVRAVVHGRVKTVKTDYSEDELPLDPGFAEVLLTWKRRLGAEREAQNGISTPLVGLDLMFPSTSTGRHYHAAPAQQDYLRKDAEREATAVARRAVGSCREVRQRRLAHVPPHLSFLAGQHFSAYRCAAETDAACPGFDDDERVRKRLDGRQA